MRGWFDRKHDCCDSCSSCGTCGSYVIPHGTQTTPNPERIPTPPLKKMPDGAKKTSSIPQIGVPAERIGAPAPRTLDLGHSPY